MANVIIGDTKFISNLDDWLFKNSQENADWIYKNKNGIPDMFRNYTKPLYRGMTVDSSFLSDVESGKMKFKAHSSWSKSKDAAKKFVNDPAFKISSKDGVKILIEKKIGKSQQILDIHSLVMFMGEPQLTMLGMDGMNVDSAFKEQEVLVAKNILITMKDITFI